MVMLRMQILSLFTLTLCINSFSLMLRLCLPRCGIDFNVKLQTSETCSCLFTVKITVLLSLNGKASVSKEVFDIFFPNFWQFKLTRIAGGRYTNEVN